MQIYMYFLGFPGDLTGVKVLVYSLFAIDTIQTVRTGLPLDDFASTRPFVDLVFFLLPLSIGDDHP